MDNYLDYEKLADNLCEIHFLYSKDLAAVFEQRSTRGEEAVLFWLSKLSNPVSAGELASHLGITSGRIANILSSLDRKKMIVRKRSSKDRRQININLTDLGSDHIQEVYRNAKENHLRLLKQMGEPEAHEFIRLMNLAIQTVSHTDSE